MKIKKKQQKTVQQVRAFAFVSPNHNPVIEAQHIPHIHRQTNTAPTKKNSQLDLTRSRAVWTTRPAVRSDQCAAQALEAPHTDLAESPTSDPIKMWEAAIGLKARQAQVQISMCGLRILELTTATAVAVTLEAATGASQA